jgi:hypothetical protein
MLERLEPEALIVYGRLIRADRERIEQSGCRLIDVAPARERLRAIA